MLTSSGYGKTCMCEDGYLRVDIAISVVALVGPVLHRRDCLLTSCGLSTPSTHALIGIPPPE
jgi:hypothetical protein